MSEGMDMSPSTRKIVQRVKEIVDLSEAEIYTTLKDCDMNPDEAVVRLTAQGSFLEVKRKREKKNKEVKVIKTPIRGSTKNSSSVGIRNGPDRYIGRGSSTHCSTYVEASSMHGKLTYGNGDGTAGYTSYIPPVSDVPGNNKSNGNYGRSNGVSAENEQPSLGKADSITSVVQSTANSDWPPLGKPADGQPISVLEYAVEPQMHPEECDVPYDDSNQHYVEEKVQEKEKGITECSETNDDSSKKIPNQVSRGEGHDDSVSAVTKDLRRLGLENDERELPSDEDELSVIIPDHLQVQSAECSHLSFGSFQPAKSSTNSLGIETSAGFESGLENGRSNKDHIYFSENANTRPKLYAGYDYASDGSLLYGNVAPEGIYDSDVASRPEEPKQYSLTSSVHDQSFNDSHSAALNQTSTRVQNHDLLSNILQSYAKPVSSTFLAANAQPDPTHKLYTTVQPTSAIYGNSLPVTGGSAISISEALKAAAIRKTQPPLPQQHLDSQSFVPHGDIHSYVYEPSNFNQSLARKNTHLQSLAAAAFPQYEGSVNASNLPYDAYRHGGFGRTTSVHGDYPVDLPASFPGRGLRYDDGSNYPYDEYRQLLLSLQQNESAANWLGRSEPLAMNTLHHQNRQRQIAQLGMGGQQQYVMPRYNYHYQNGGDSPLDRQGYPRDF